MSKQITLIGGGLHARVVIDLLHDCGLSPAVMVDPNDHLGSYRNVDVIHPDEFDPRGKQILIAIGNVALRAELAARYLSEGATLAPAVIHPSVHQSPSAQCGVGSTVLPGSILDTNCLLGDNVLVNLNTVIGHDVTVGAHSHISARVVLGGAAVIGSVTTVGLGATVCPKIVVGNQVTVGAGAVVVQDVPDGIRVLGVPAREG